MNSTRILVSQTTEDVLAESIAMDIRRRPDVSLFVEEVMPARQLASRLKSGRELPNVIILVGKNGELQGYASDLLEQHPDIVVASIVIGSDQVRMDLRKVGLSELIASVCELSRYRCGNALALTTAVNVREETELHDSCFGVVDSPTGEVLLVAVLNWLDAVLLWHLQRTSDSASDLPGLTISRDTVEELFKARPAVSSDSRKQAESAENNFLRVLEKIGAGEDPLARLCQGLQLDWLEIKAFLVCLAPELDTRYQRVFGFLHDDLSRRHATWGLLAAILGDPHKLHPGLGQIDSLFRWGLIGSHAKSGPYADEPLRVDPTLVSWITGNADALGRDRALADLVLTEPWPGADLLGELDDVPECGQLVESLSSGEEVDWIVLTGPDASGCRALVELAAHQLGLSILRIAQAGLNTADATGTDTRIVRLGWIARLTDCLPVIDVSGMASQPRSTENLRSIIDAVAVPGRTGVLLTSDISQVIDVLRDDGYRLLHWDSGAALLPVSVLARAAQKAGLRLGHDDCEPLTTAYPLTISETSRAVKLAVARGAAAEKSPPRQMALLSEACRQVICPELPRFATALQPVFQLDDVVLPADRRQQLDDIVSHVRHAGTVLNTWGFGAQLPYGRGVTALFIGPSGTGKTMAAQAIGRALQRTVFAVDLSRVASKYIGDTEKHLDSVFLEAERAGAALVFDEADALFGKRSEVKDAHDRYANIETAYLLQRMEAFGGLAILTTNFAQNLDSAFLRRLRFTIEFPSPDAAAREKIWRQCLPLDAPLAEDLDFRFLARRVEKISGGNIRQITLRAAFSAAAEGVPISLDHILKATRAEVLKLGMPGLARELSDQAA